ncbi:MAG: hypothetical protein ACOWWM_09565 [Desulfobacterales bacterium]
MKNFRKKTADAVAAVICAGICAALLLLAAAEYLSRYIPRSH